MNPVARCVPSTSAQTLPQTSYQLLRVALIGLFIAFAASGVVSAAINPARDWPAWRGPTADGIAASGQTPPVEWSESKGVIWRAPLPGRGHGSPIVVEDRVYLATADPVKQSQSVVCLDRNTGEPVWESVVHGSGADAGRHANSSAASSTLACDGEQLYINFLNSGAVYTTALSMQGKVQWQTRVSDFLVHQGFASSPFLYQSLVIVSADSRAGGAVAGLDRKSGKIVWSEARPKVANYTSPMVVHAGGRPQMVVAGCRLLTSLDPMTGKKLWELEGSTEECVGSVVTDGVRVFASGGWPKNHTMAVVADGSNTIAWQNNSRVYVPSMIAKDGYLYAVMDAGFAVCWKSDTGAEVWKERLGGDFFSSPVMVGDRVYASNINGKSFVFQANPTGFKLLAQNQLGDEAYASPVVCGSRVYLRVATRGETRQEYLYCIGGLPAPL